MKLKIFLACATLTLGFSASARTYRPNIVIIETRAGLTSDSSMTSRSWQEELFPEGYRFVYAYGGSADALDGLSDMMSSEGYEITELPAYEGTRPLFARIRVETHDALYNTVSVLRQCGLYADALIILTSESGDTPYHDSWHIPMIVKLPSSRRSTLPRGSSVTDPVTTADIPPTVLHAAGIRRNGGDGESMLPLIRRKAKAWRHYVYFVNDEYMAVTDGRFKYIQPRNGGEELYNLLVDPYETDNIAGRRSILLNIMREAAKVR